MSPEESSQERPKPKRNVPNLAVRFLTAGIGIPIVLWMLFLAPPTVFSLSSFGFAAVGASELAGMTLKGQRALGAWMVIATMAVTGALVWLPTEDALLGIVFGLMITGPLATLFKPDPLEDAAAKMGWLIAGPLYIGAAIGAIAMLHHVDQGGGNWVVLSMALAWGSDTGGYFAGKAFGRHKLYEKISPKKTIEGSIGGLVAIVLLALIWSYVWLPALTPLHAVILALGAGAAGQAGDLCISAIKRSMGVKDSGFIIPGHGGLLDRIDALMFTASITLLYTHYILELDRTVPTF